MKIKESPCAASCKAHESCSRKEDCTAWKDWLYEVWPIVTGRVKTEVPVDPNLEIVGIVRCQDCAHHEDAIVCWCNKHHRAVSEQDFCNYGERGRK